VAAATPPDATGNCLPLSAGALSESSARSRRTREARLHQHSELDSGKVGLAVEVCKRPDRLARTPETPVIEEPSSRSGRRGISAIGRPTVLQRTVAGLTGGNSIANRRAVRLKMPVQGSLRLAGMRDRRPLCCFAGSSRPYRGENARAPSSQFRRNGELSSSGSARGVLTAEIETKINTIRTMETKIMACRELRLLTGFHPRDSRSPPPPPIFHSFKSLNPTEMPIPPPTSQALSAPEVPSTMSRSARRLASPGVGCRTKLIAAETHVLGV